jgi:hypothetical protein
MKKTLSIIILGIAIIAIIIFFVTNNFGADLMLCNKTNGDCNVIAKFKNFETCQAMNERWGWYCDQVSDPKQIVCHTGEGTLGFAYCKK